MKNSFLAIGLLISSFSLTAHAEGICGRSKPAIKAITASLMTSRKCQKINSADLLTVTNLDFSEEFPGVPAQRNFLKSGDLDGLSNLTSLRFTRHMGLRSGEKAPYIKDGKLPANLLADLKSLKNLYLNGALSEVSETDFEALTALEYLRLDSSPFTTLPSGVFKNLSSLKTLDLSSSRMDALPSDIFQGLSQLEELLIYANEFKSLPTGIFSGLSNLKELKIYATPIGSLDLNAFQDLKSLEVLVMDRTKLVSFPRALIEGLTNLKFINISLNDISSFEPGLFSNFPALETLNLRGNPVGVLPEDLFKDSPSIKNLYLGSMSLTCVSPEMFGSMANLVEVYLDWNPLQKECYQALVDTIGKDKVVMENFWN